MIVEERPLGEITQAGYRALVEELGVADTIRFLHQYGMGEGDYTAERHTWLDGITMDELVAEIKQFDRERGH